MKRLPIIMECLLVSVFMSSLIVFLSTQYLSLTKLPHTVSTPNIDLNIKAFSEIDNGKGVRRPKIIDTSKFIRDNRYLK